MEGLSRLDEAFGALAHRDDEAEQLYDQFHQMIGRAEVGPYRPYPDAFPRARVALI